MPQRVEGRARRQDHAGQLLGPIEQRIEPGALAQPEDATLGLVEASQRRDDGRRKMNRYRLAILCLAQQRGRPRQINIAPRQTERLAQSWPDIQ
jgi:hypothetical protein